MSGTSTTDPIADAHQLCEGRGLFILAVSDNFYDKKLGCRRSVQAWVVYRGKKGQHAARLGRRRNPRALLSYVRTLI